jgi:hypothetical protein
MYDKIKLGTVITWRQVKLEISHIILSKISRAFLGELERGNLSKKTLEFHMWNYQLQMKFHIQISHLYSMVLQ